ncbi:sodium:proton antiporter [Gephyromycinifex aptenodytis]|uniref:sodium:proton antiporter n=1 Tax=Gephyromycinifex aptenodytis TaxID=2716227 RepID=UPI0014478E34|nr:sodium:proton antiporter [Gephyromycinifex aptenodytis]
MDYPWWTIIPFVIMLGSIAVLPLLPATAHRWEKPSFQLTLALCLGIPVAIGVWLLAGEPIAVVHALIEYAQFITLLASLFVVSGAIFLAGDIRATPRNNTLFLAVGGVMASFIGTTGAAMLLIRPLLNTNHERRYRMHTVIFTIFVVANCGGLLTPLGDPPLFLGMLRGVPFEWTFRLFPEWLFVNGMLLASYYLLDRRLYAQEDPETITYDAETVTPLGVRGPVAFLWFATIVVAVAFLPSINLHLIEIRQATWVHWVPWREIVMIIAAALSYVIGDRRVRFEDNQFTWAPILEVAALFIGIFLTMIPALKYLAQVAPSMPLDHITFFYFTGGLSAVLDNAPTYATFFEMARNLPGYPRVANVPEVFLVSISLGSVLCGAITYIGNGPNFMVKSVAEKRGVQMPSFGGYVVQSFTHLVPILVAMVLIFIAHSLLAHALGVALAAAILLLAWVRSRRAQAAGVPATIRR